MRSYAIMREPGRAAARARERREARFSVLLSTPRPRRMAVVEATGVVDAFGEFIYRRYLTTFHPQYAGHTVEYRHRGKWVTWHEAADPHDRRDYRLIVTLRNGRNQHDATFYAWRLP